MTPDGACLCPQCMGSEEPEHDEFEEWADDESERQFDMHASHEAEPELRCIPYCSAQDQSKEGSEL